jgi:uncharacterized protein YcbK (DUF882 family)
MELGDRMGIVKTERSVIVGIRLPAVKRVQLVIDDVFIRKCLKKRRITDVQNINWPEALRAVYRQAEKAENELLHIESVCRKAREEQITPYKNKLYDLIRHYSATRDL